MSHDPSDILRLTDSYAFVRFTACNIHGLPLTKVVPTKALSSFLPNGPDLFFGIFAFGINYAMPDIALFDALEYVNMSMYPDLKTIRHLSYEDKDDGNGKTCEVLCNLVWPQKVSHVTSISVRELLCIQLDKLKAKGLTWYSTHELEFTLLHGDGKPIFDGQRYAISDLPDDVKTFLKTITTTLIDMGVPVELYHTEYSPGQLEFNIAPQEGILTADGVFVFRSTVREMARKYGLKAVFMTKADPTFCANGMHLNFSLRNLGTTDDAFLANPNDCVAVKFSGKAEATTMSPLMIHWIGGLQKHATALTAICCPTVNCYRRLHNPWAPDFNNWAIDNRMATVRVKLDSPRGPYLELRTPSMVANPYMVAVATIAAGIDGMENQIQPTFEKSCELGRMPDTLTESLEALKSDSVLRDALGKTVVDLFVQVKEKVEIAKLDGVENDKSALQFESDLYFDWT